MSTFPRAALVCLASAILIDCGGTSGPNPPPPPPPPGNLVKQAGDNQNANVGQPVATPPAVKVTTSAGVAIQGVQVTFAVASGGGGVTGATPSTGADGMAAVGSWTLGPAAGPNTLTATIAGSGVTGNPATFTANGQLTSFNPTANTNLSGTQNFASVNIPAGVTITMTADLVLNVTGAVTIAGSLVGACVNLTINADGALTISGTLNNGCTGAIPANLPAITLVGKGGYSLNGANVTVAGDFKITDDPTATDADFAPGPTPPSRLRGDGARASVGVPCNVGAFTGTATPATMPPNGVAGSPNGVDGGDGKTWTLWCKGGGDISVGTLSLTGQNGGAGGAGTHSDATAAVSRGGKGGKGGAVKIQSKGNLVIGPGAGSTVTTGRGGDGGSATATGTGGGGSTGASADATGGAGGAPGLFTGTAAGGITINGSLTLSIGIAGRGGDATATGGDGHNAPPCPPAVGGPATATGGAGGSTPDKTLTAAGAVTGLVNVTVTGGTPGAGGNAVANAGKGGAGAQPCKPGAVGGAPTAKGGKGGNADLKDRNGIKVANGGNGGSMEVKNGKGGQGWNDCILPIFEAGGPGGMGGSIAGLNGAFGTGLANGTAGAATYTTVANGGNGGDGLPPGAGGPAGGNGVTLNGGVTPTIVAPSFVPGTPGVECNAFSMLVTPPTQTVVQGGTGSIHVVVTRTGTFTGAVTVQVKDQGGTVRGSGTLPGISSFFDVFLTVPLTEPAGTRDWTATGSGAGAPDVVQPVGLNVTPPGAPPTVDIDLNTMPHTGNLVPFGTHLLNLTLSATTRGTVQIQTVFNPMNHFWSNSGPAGLRVGSGDGNGYRLLLNTAMVDGSPYAIAGYGYCLRNAGGIDAAHPVMINQRNSGGTIIMTENVTSLPNGNAGPLCKWTTIMSGASSVEILPGAGTFIDFGNTQIWRP